MGGEIKKNSNQGILLICKTILLTLLTAGLSLCSIMHAAEKVSAIEVSRGYGEPAKSKLFRKDEHHTPIQPLVDKVPPNGELILQEENYAGPLYINKPITIKGLNDQSTIFISGEEQTILVQSDGVELKSVMIIDERKQPQAAVIKAEGYAQAKFTQLIIQTRATAIEMINMKQSMLLANQVEWKGEANTKRTDRGNGIYVYGSSEIEIASNSITDMYDGVYVENSRDVSISGNMVTDSRYAYHMMYTEQIEIVGNESKNNITGLMIMTSNDVSLRQNKLTGHQANANASAVLIYDVLDVEVAGNLISNNRIGITLERSEKIKVSYNELLHNFVALQMQKADELEVMENEFISNVSNVWNDGIGKPRIMNNYWDTLLGLDLNGDGYSELPYKSSPFFLNLIERRPSFQLLFGTTGIAFIEQMYQADSQNWISDSAPSNRAQLMSASSDPKIQWLMLLGWLLLTITAIYLVIKVRRYEQ